jgi:hypothetical protein
MIIMVAIALLALTLLSAIVLDQGILYASRRQAQNAADAGAMSAAINMRDDPSDLNEARAAARTAANANPVWGEAPAAANVLVDLVITCPPGTGGGSGCVRVDVMRGGVDRFGNAHTNTLPTFFANLAGITSQHISATATAMVSAGNSVQCIKPWVLADKWTDSTPDTDPFPYNGDSWDRDDDFIPGTDTYNSANGYNPAQHTGYQMPLKPGNIGTWSSGWAMEIDYPSHTGSSEYNTNIEGCPEWVPTVGIFNPSGYAGAHPGAGCNAQNDPDDPERGCLSVKTGMSQGPTSAGVATLVGLDSGATWVVGDNPATVDVELGYVSSPCMIANNCQAYFGDPGVLRHVDVSPRIVPIAIFNTAAFVNETCSGSGCVAQVINLAGFFVEGMCSDVYPNAATRPTWCGSPSDANKIVVGRFMKYPGTFSGEGGTTTSTFAQAIRLVR